LHSGGWAWVVGRSPTVVVLEIGQRVELVRLECAGQLQTRGQTSSRISAPLQAASSCQGADGALFFAGDPERRSSRSKREARAKAICHRCPVIDQCLDFALRVEEPCGIWGGLSEDERGRVIMERR